jgi:hypothetical protein
LTGWLHFSDLLDPDNLNEDQSNTAYVYMTKMVIALNIYHILRGYQWKGIIEIVNGDACGAKVEFTSKDEAIRFDVDHRSPVERASFLSNPC